jgi:hypothetical protein
VQIEVQNAIRPASISIPLSGRILRQGIGSRNIFVSTPDVEKVKNSVIFQHVGIGHFRLARRIAVA